MIDRRNFLRTAAAAVLGLVARFGERREPAAGKDETGVIVVNGMSLDDLGPEAIATLEDILHLYWGDTDLLIEDESGVFPGIDQYVTTGYLDAESKPCPPVESITTWA